MTKEAGASRPLDYSGVGN